MANKSITYLANYTNKIDKLANEGCSKQELIDYIQSLAYEVDPVDIFYLRSYVRKMEGIQ